MNEQTRRISTSGFYSFILNKQVSWHENVWTASDRFLTIHETLSLIRAGMVRNQVQQLRSLLGSGQDEEYNSMKLTLPAVTFSARFEGGRKKTNLEHYNSILSFDIDGLGSAALAKARNSLWEDELVFSYFDSPSRRGLKGLVAINFRFALTEHNLEAAHKLAFTKLADRFEDWHELRLDPSGSDITRLCFLSWDSKLVLKEKIVPLEVTKEEMLSFLKPNKNAKAISSPGDRHLGKTIDEPKNIETMESIIEFLNKTGASITESYLDWFKVAMALCNSFSYQFAEGFFLRLSKMDVNKFVHENCIRFIRHCYQTNNGALKFNSIVYFAQNKGFRI
ncbi:MAG TPA: BT4734/BF3469 family protein [Puia sp.]|nr:BT4734/BF3469 family protein [Puia sp.]